ncbi:MAG: PadR family transcriptional regulator [Thermoanaerobaculia bacterium]
MRERHELELRRGLVTLAALSALRTPTYGYSLREALSERGLEVDQGTLYPLLRRLDEQGLLLSDWNTEGPRPRKYYRLSPAGETVLGSLREEWRELARVVGDLLEHPIGEGR